jgi:hypothetical protein
VVVSRLTYERQSLDVRAALEAAFLALHVSERPAAAPPRDEGEPAPGLMPEPVPVGLASLPAPIGRARPGP